MKKAAIFGPSTYERVTAEAPCERRTSPAERRPTAGGGCAPGWPAVCRCEADLVPEVEAALLEILRAAASGVFFHDAAVERMNLQTTGMELASEIVIKASILGMNVSEVPTTLSPDGRDRPPHLRSFRDGWRHLRFLLIYSPRWLFFYPGLILAIIGLLFSIILSAGPVHFPFRLVDFHSFIVAGTLVILGLNILAFYAITHIYAFYTGLLPKPPSFYPWFKYLNLEKGLFLGALCFCIGVGIILFAASLSQMPGGFETIGFGRSVRLVFGGSLTIILGTQVIFTSFVLSMLGMNVRQ